MNAFYCGQRTLTMQQPLKPNESIAAGWYLPLAVAVALGVASALLWYFSASVATTTVAASLALGAALLCFLLCAFGLQPSGSHTHVT